MTKEHVSKCCGAKVKWNIDIYSDCIRVFHGKKDYICQKCHKPCEVIEKEKK